MSAKFEVKNGVLHCEIPLAKTPQPSKSGKTLVIASSHGFADLGVKTKDGQPIKGSFNFTIPNS